MLGIVLNRNVSSTSDKRLKNSKILSQNIQLAIKRCNASMRYKCGYSQGINFLNVADKRYM